jgi:hypothetical protein
MKTTKTQHTWAAFFKLFSEQNESRPTRIGVFEGERGDMTDYWLEDGLPLEGIDIDSRSGAAPTIEIMLGSREDAEKRVFTHKIANARYVKMTLSASGESDELEIEDDRGAVTVMRFENGL